MMTRSAAAIGLVLLFCRSACEQIGNERSPLSLSGHYYPVSAAATTPWWQPANYNFTIFHTPGVAFPHWEARWWRCDLLSAASLALDASVGEVPAKILGYK